MEVLHVVARKWSPGVTVRLGAKWLGRDGWQVRLCECWPDASTASTLHEDAGLATVHARWFGPLDRIPAVLVDEHYDPECRTYSGLARALSSVYKHVYPASLVAVMEVRLLGAHPNTAKETA